MPLSEVIPGIADGRATFCAALARGIRPPPRVTVSEWAAKKRFVGAESGSPHPGPWDNDRVPHLVEIMDRLSFTDPCTHVAVKGPAQSAKSEGGVNLFGYIVDIEPAPVLIVLPSLDEAKKYNKTKLQPTIDATEVLGEKVRDDKSRDTTGSTALMKRFRGGYAIITGANSSKGLQMISARVLIREEISEWPDDVDGRGDPMDMAEDRLTAWRQRGVKILDVSTPGIAGYCRISANEEAGDRSRRYVPCPHCGVFQQLVWERFRWTDEEGRRVPAHFRCGRCDRKIEHHHKLAINIRGAWLPTYVDAEDPEGNPCPPALVEPDAVERWRSRPVKGRQPSYAWWAVLNSFMSWEDIVRDYELRKDTPAKLKVFHQQKLAEAWEEVVDVPDAARLADRTVDFPLGRLPEGAAFLVGFCDVQGDRLEWSVYAVGPHLTMWEIDFGVLPGDPAKADVWERLWQVARRQYPNARGRLWGVEAFGVDSGYLSNQVYIFSRRSPLIYATDGRDGPLAPALGAARPVDVSINGRAIKGGAQIWPIGTHSMKVEVMAALQVTLAGQDEHGAFQPGALIHSRRRGVDYFDQLTAEVLDKDQDTGKRRWRRRKKGLANEALDIAVGCRALAYHVGAGWLDDAGWQKLLAERQAPPPDGQMDLLTRPLAEPPGAAPAAPASGADALPPEAVTVAPATANDVRKIVSKLA